MTFKEAGIASTALLEDWKTLGKGQANQLDLIAPKGIASIAKRKDPWPQ